MEDNREEVRVLRSKWRRFWPVIAVIVVAAGVLAAHLCVDFLTREPPNYSHIEDGFWVGGDAEEPPPGTQAVLNLCEIPDRYQVESHRWRSIRDAAPAPTLEWLREQVDFIESERSAGRVVYVHCRNGVSRSGMVAAAYLMRRERWSRDQALDFLRQHRPSVRPNPAFMQLLVDWERSLGK